MAKQALSFILDKNLELPVTEKPWASILAEAGITTQATTDLVRIDRMLTDEGPDIAYVPGADFCVMMKKGNQHYRGLVIATSKFSGQSAQRTLLVVRRDDVAKSIDDLKGSEYGYMNTSCSSSFFPPAILLQQKGKELRQFLKLKAVPGWQTRVDAVVAKSIRSTMILEDVWKMTPGNVNVAKVIGEYVPSPPAILIVRKTLESNVVDTLREHLLSYKPEWTNVYGAFRPYYFADVQTFYHQLSQLPEEDL